MELDVLARGPWEPGAVTSRWLSEPYVYDPTAQRLAGEALAGLGRRGSPSHEGVAARLVEFAAVDSTLTLTLQRAPWSARLLEGDKHESLATVCVVRDAAGRWLAGRRADWLAIWPGVWMLGGAGGVEPGEDPVTTLGREVEEEWSVPAGRLSIEALVRLPDGLLWLVGQAWLPEGADPVADEEHDGHAWWPPEVSAWPDEARAELRAVGELLSG